MSNKLLEYLSSNPHAIAAMGRASARLIRGEDLAAVAMCEFGPVLAPYAMSVLGDAMVPPAIEVKTAKVKAPKVVRVAKPSKKTAFNDDDELVVPPSFYGLAIGPTRQSMVQVPVRMLPPASKKEDVIDAEYVIIEAG